MPKLGQPKQLPLKLRAKTKRQVRSQFGALCYREVDGKVQVLLVTSRHRKRWILPKGWPEDGQTPAETAATEAWEEAGAKGKVFNRCIGAYGYVKQSGPLKGVPCVVMIYPLRVKSTKKDYPEREFRKRKWVSRKEAAARVDGKDLKALIKTFDPGIL